MSYLKNGWRIDRNADGSVTISVHVRGSSGHVTEVHHLTLSASEWCSVVALVSANGKSAKPTLEAIHNGTQVQRAETSTGAAPGPRIPHNQKRGAPGTAGAATRRGKPRGDIAPPEGGAETAEVAPAEVIPNADQASAAETPAG